MAKTYPIALRGLDGLKVVVVGGGRVGERKVRGVLVTGAMVTVISPVVTAGLQQLAISGAIRVVVRHFQEDDLVGAALVFAATDVRAVNARVAAAAGALGILCNVADAPAEGDFYTMGVIRHEDAVIAVGTDGKSPRRARQLRRQITAWLRTLTALRDDDTTDETNSE